MLQAVFFIYIFKILLNVSQEKLQAVNKSKIWCTQRCRNMPYIFHISDKALNKSHLTHITKKCHQYFSQSRFSLTICGLGRIMENSRVQNNCSQSDSVSLDSRLPLLSISLSSVLHITRLHSCVVDLYHIKMSLDRKP